MKVQLEANEWYPVYTIESMASVWEHQKQFHKGETFEDFVESYPYEVIDISEDDFNRIQKVFDDFNKVKDELGAKSCAG